jgi:FHS family L-fucose permease-like MFS transporter
VTLLGPQETGARRLLGAQSVLALGSALAPFCVTLGHSALGPDPAAMLARVRIVYVSAGVLLLGLTAVFIFRRGDRFMPSPAKPSLEARRIPLRASMVFALLAVFLFVGTEATVITHILRYQLNFSSSRVIAPALPWAGTLSIYWLSVMAGRMLSYRMLRRVNLIKLLQGAAFLGALLVSVAVLWCGNLGLIAILATGFVNAAIFPLIFCAITESLNQQQMATASGWLMTAMCGGAVIPPICGATADHFGLRAAFVIPVLSYLWIACTASRCRPSAQILRERRPFRRAAGMRIHRPAPFATGYERTAADMDFAETRREAYQQHRENRACREPGM